MNAPLGRPSSGSLHHADGPLLRPAASGAPGPLRHLKRVALLLAAAAIFLSAASVIKPSPRSAQAGHPQATHVRSSSAPNAPGDGPELRAPREEATHPKGYKLLGTFEGREHMLRCWSTPQGVRYSVHTPDGSLLQDDLPADEVYRGFPDIDLEHLQLDPAHPGALMMVDTSRD